MKLVSFIYLIFFSTQVLASTPQVRTNAFIVKIFDERVAVTSPIKEEKEVSVIIENKTLVKVVGKVETESGQILGYISLPPKKFQTLSLAQRGKEKVYFIPMSPASQRVILKFNNKAYEIPPKEQN
tara:strand:+ start:247512 stop:247889 length:378 start_codon:yes stop_codon:yes gene_type:complete